MEVLRGPMRLVIAIAVAFPILKLRIMPVDQFESLEVAGFVTREVPFFFSTLWMFGFSDWFALKCGLYARISEQKLICDKTDDDYQSCEALTADTVRAISV